MFAAVALTGCMPWGPQALWSSGGHLDVISKSPQGRLRDPILLRARLRAKPTGMPLAPNPSNLPVDRPDPTGPGTPILAAAAVSALRRRRKGKQTGAILTRYSTKDQCSTDDQVRLCREFANANGIDVPDHLVFSDEGTTGRKKKRENLMALIQAIESGKVDTVLIFKTSRLFRKTYKALQFVHEEIVGRGLRCVFVAQGIDTDRSEQWRTLLHFHAIMDEMQATSGVEHIRAAQEGLFLQQMVHGTITFGYCGQKIPRQVNRAGRPRRTLAIDPETSTWVRRAFGWYIAAEGSRDGIPSIKAIAKLLNQHKAPLPPRCASGRWTWQAARRLLANPRYRGHWEYGTRETVWLDKQDYARQVLRDEPIRSLQIEELRIVSDKVWFKVQELMASNPHVAGRRSKDGDRTSRPKLLNGILRCGYDGRRLVTGGGHGRKMLCPVCKETGGRLFTLLDRKLATSMICTRIADLIRSDAKLVRDVIAACRTAVGSRQKPDAAKLAELSRQAMAITRRITLVKDYPIDTDQDALENRQMIGDLRKRRTGIQAEVARLESAAANTVKVPSEDEVRSLLVSLADSLLIAVESGKPDHVARARRVLDVITGGKILVYQDGPAEPQRGWLRCVFRVHALQLTAQHCGIADTVDDGVEIEIVLREPPAHERIADEVKTLWDGGLKYTEIADRVGSSRNSVAKAVAFWHESRGLSVPDGRRHVGRLKKGPPLAERIADRVMEFVDQQIPLGDIAAKLETSRNRITEALRIWHEKRSLPVPDGRTLRKQRRKRRKSRR